MKTKAIIGLLVTTGIAGLLLSSCGSGSNNGKVLDTPTSGSINIAIDESFKLFMDSEATTFESLYPKTKINTLYMPEGDGFKALMNDSVRLVIASRELNQMEKDYFKKITITPHVTKIAKDALAFIINNTNNDTLLTYQQLMSIFTGKINNWKQLNPNTALGNMQVVFDQNNSSTYNFILDSLAHISKLPSNCYASKSNADMVEYISKNENSIGVIGVNWISDLDETISSQFLSKVKVMAVSGKDITSPSRGDYYKPYQAYIATGAYPVVRNVYIVTREARDGLGAGFTAFVAGEKGQRIILKSALVPATMPVRIVGFK